MEYPTTPAVLSTPVMNKTCARLSREFSTVDGLDRACIWRARGIAWRPISPDHERSRAQACSYGVLLPRAMQEEGIRLLCALVHYHIRFPSLEDDVCSRQVHRYFLR